MKFSEREREDMVKKIAYDTIKLSINNILKEDIDGKETKSFASKVKAILLFVEDGARKKVEKFENMSDKERKEYGKRKSD